MSLVDLQITAMRIIQDFNNNVGKPSINAYAFIILGYFLALRKMGFISEEDNSEMLEQVFTALENNTELKVTVAFKERGAE